MLVAICQLLLASGLLLPSGDALFPNTAIWLAER
jgi:hypothetical protein